MLYLVDKNQNLKMTALNRKKWGTWYGVFGQTLYVKVSLFMWATFAVNIFQG